MKKHIKIAFAYAVAAMACGVFYREFTKGMDFTGVTALGKVHTHLFMLGTVVFLLTALFDSRLNLTDSKLYKPFMVIYNIGVPAASAMMLARGVVQVCGTALSDGGNAAISGVSGIAHVITAAGLVLFFIMLIKRSGDMRGKNNATGDAEKDSAPADDNAAE